MQYKILGKTGLKVSVIGFGGIAIQRGSAELAKAVIIKAGELGINFIDTARGYTVSEEYIGAALVDQRQNWIIATKSMARDKESMARDIEISQKNLRTDYIDLYQIHNIRNQAELDQVMGGGGAYQALQAAQSEGKIGHIGISAHSPEMLQAALETGKFASVMYSYNIIENQGEEIFRKAKELNIGVIAMKPMAGGSIDDAKLALKYLLQNEAITTAIPGMGDLKEVEENVAAAANISKMTKEDLAKMDLIKSQLGSQFCRRCGYCMPCPEGIDIPTVFLLSGYKERYNLVEWSEERYKSQPARAIHCTECGSCETKCPYNLPIREMLKSARQVFRE